MAVLLTSGPALTLHSVQFDVVGKVGVPITIVPALTAGAVPEDKTTPLADAVCV